MNFPKWLPDAIAQEAEIILSSPCTEEAKEVVTRLTTRPEMRNVWEKLSTQEIQPKASILSMALHILNYWEFMKDYCLLLKPGERRARVSEIFAAIDNLQQLLRKNHLLIFGYEPECANPVDIELDAIKRELETSSIFWNDLPTKINARNARQTFFIKSLKRTVASYYGKPLYQEVAEITCVIFDVIDIDADRVKKA